MLRLVLAPAQRLLTERGHFPQSAAAIFLVLTLFGVIAVAAFTLSIPATNWIQKAPESLPVLKEKLAILRQPLSSTLKDHADRG